MVRFFLACCVVFAAPALVQAEDDEPTTLYPAPLPSPALKYRLLPDLRSQTGDDALPLYNDAIAKFLPLQKEIFQQRPDDPFSKWAATPLKELPRDEVRKTLEPFKDVFELLDKAARCSVRTGGDGVQGGSKLPEAFYLQELSTLLVVRARLQIADGDLRAALRTLQTGLAVAKHTGEMPRFGYAFTAGEMAEAMLRPIEDFVQQPKAPNLYWALTDLPQPLFDLRNSVEGERLAQYQRFPGVAEASADLNAGPATEEQVQDYVRYLLRFYREPGILDIQSRVQLTKQITGLYDESKKALLDQGRPKEKVEAMPHVQVALLAAFHNYELLMDEQMKWANEPYFKVGDRLQRLTKTLESRPLEKRLQPVVAFDAMRLLRSRAALERKINMLRCLEAIRAFAAAHDGKLPATLDGVKDVPMPLDPVTGKAFVYKAADGKATLDAPEVSREERRYFDEQAYEIVIKRS